MSSVEDFQVILDGVVAEFVASTRRLGEPVMSNLAEMVSRAFQYEFEFIDDGVRRQQPANDEELRRVADRTLGALREIQDYRERNRIEQYNNHLATVAESISALNWITVQNTPLQFIRDMRDAGEYYGNRVRTAHRGDVEHISWINNWNAVLRSLEEYVRNHHRTGFSWNAIAAAERRRQPVAANLPPPPPPPPLPIFGHRFPGGDGNFRGAGLPAGLRGQGDGPHIRAAGFPAGHRGDGDGPHIRAAGLPAGHHGQGDGPHIRAAGLPAGHRGQGDGPHIRAAGLPAGHRGRGDGPHIRAAGLPAVGLPAAGLPAAGLPAAGLPAAGLPAGHHGGDEPVHPLFNPEIHADRQQMLIQINQGPRIMQMLRPVNLGVAQHAAPVAQHAAAPVAQRAAAPLAQRAAAPAHPPLFILEGRRWRVEYHRFNQGLTLDPNDMSETLAMFMCERSTLRTTAKMNAVTIDNCRRCVVVLDDIISSVELIRCQNVEIRCTGSCPNVTIDHCDSIQVFLSDNSADCEVITAQSTSTNISRLAADGDYIEFPVPEQIRSVLVDGNLQSSVIEHRM